MTSAQLDAGLTIDTIGEHALIDWRALPMLEYIFNLTGWTMFRGRPQIPLTFSIVTTKPL